MTNRRTWASLPVTPNPSSGRWRRRSVSHGPPRSCTRCAPSIATSSASGRAPWARRACGSASRSGGASTLDGSTSSRASGTWRRGAAGSRSGLTPAAAELWPPTRSTSYTTLRSGRTDHPGHLRSRSSRWETDAIDVRIDKVMRANLKQRIKGSRRLRVLTVKAGMISDDYFCRPAILVVVDQSPAEHRARRGAPPGHAGSHVQPPGRRLGNHE